MPKTALNKVTSLHGEYDESPSTLNDLDLLASALSAMLYSGINTQQPKKQQLANLATAAVVQNGRDFYMAFNNLNLEPRLNSPAANLGVLSANNPAELGMVATVSPVPPGQPLPPAPGGSDPNTYTDPKKNSVNLITNVLVNGSQPHMLVTKRLVNKFRAGEVVFSPKETIKSTLFQMINDGQCAPGLGTSIGKIVVLTPSTESFEHAEMRLLRFMTHNDISSKAIGVSKPCCHLCATALDGAGVTFTRWSDVPGMKGWRAPDEITSTVVNTL